jgi:hypothetical protein
MSSLLGAKGLRPGFDTWVRLCFLHLWLLEVRFRYLLDSRERDALTQPIYSWLWEDIELGLLDVMVHLYFNNLLMFSRTPQTLSSYQNTPRGLYKSGSVLLSPSMSEWLQVMPRWLKQSGGSLL